MRYVGISSAVVSMMEFRRLKSKDLTVNVGDWFAIGSRANRCH